MSKQDMLNELRRLQGSSMNLLRIARFAAPERRAELEAEAEKLLQRRLKLQAELEAAGIYL